MKGTEVIFFLQFFETLTVVQLLSKFPASCETPRITPVHTDLLIHFCPEPDESNPHPDTPFKIYFDTPPNPNIVSISR
jgi:hypothetical protein